MSNYVNSTEPLEKNEIFVHISNNNKCRSNTQRYVVKAETTHNMHYEIYIKFVKTDRGEDALTSPI